MEQKLIVMKAPMAGLFIKNKMTRKARTANSTYKKLADQCSADTFVDNQSLVLRINICGENRQLLVAANR